MLALSAAAGARVLYATKLIAGSGSGFGQSTTPWKYFLTQGHALPGYLWRLLVPVRMSIDPARPPDSLEVAILAWVVLALALTIASWFWAKSAQPGFWLIPAWLLLLPSSSIFPAADAVAYRRLYLPMALIAIAFALIGAKYPKPALALILLWTAFAAARRATWQSEEALWREAAELAPTQSRPLLQLARLTPRDEALRHLDKAKLLTPADPEVASERGRVWLESGDAAQALAEFGRALALAPTNARHIQNRGAALLALGQSEAAKADFLRALQRDPCLKPARENLVRLGVQPPPDPCPTTNFAAK
jgi:tetratricopeptide (TPR) repeat protein